MGHMMHTMADMEHIAQAHAPQLVTMCHLAAAEAPLPPSLAWKGNGTRQQQTAAGSGGAKMGSAWGTQDKGVQVRAFRFPLLSSGGGGPFMFP